MKKAALILMLTALAACLPAITGCSGGNAGSAGNVTGYWVWKIPNATGTLEILKLDGNGKVRGFEDFCEGAYNFNGTYRISGNTVTMDLGKPKEGRRVLVKKGDALIDEKEGRTFIRPDKAPIDFDVKIYFEQ